MSANCLHCSTVLEPATLYKVRRHFKRVILEPTLTG